MSIASDVINTNTKLTTVRNELRELLTQHGIVYYSDDDVFTLARRVWFLVHPTNGSPGGAYQDYAVVGRPVGVCLPAGAAVSHSDRRCPGGCGARAAGRAVDIRGMRGNGGQDDLRARAKACARAGAAVCRGKGADGAEEAAGAIARGQDRAAGAEIRIN